jgi:hypothetical protein
MEKQIASEVVLGVFIAMAFSQVPSMSLRIIDRILNVIGRKGL